MVRMCSFPGCDNREKAVRLRPKALSQEDSLTFHRFPLNEPSRLRQWLRVLQIDFSTPIQTINSMRVCSKHFSPSDFRVLKGGSRRFLKSTAVPVRAEGGDPTQSSQDLEDADDDGDTKIVPSTTSFGQCEKSQSKVILMIKRPEELGQQTYYARPPMHSYQSNKPTQTEQQSEESFDQDVKMVAVDSSSDEKDVSFAPLSSTPSPITEDEDEEEEENVHKEERKWLVNESSLMELFRICHQCGGPVTETKTLNSGSLICVQWECLNGHQGLWSSSPDVQGMPANDLLVAACTVFTGATYADIADWASLLNLQVPDKTAFYAIQSSYLTPVIDATYREQQAELLNILRMQNILQKGVHLSGDGRSDSPGFSAKYNTYSLMDDTTDQIVHFELVQVAEASSSVAMEPIGFKRGLNKLLDQGIKIEVMTTDRSPSLMKIMQVDYPDIHHEFDIWHVVKGFFKKLLSLSRRKGNQEVQPWIKSICNHLWYACATCGGNPDILTKKWKFLLHHICGVHSWMEDGIQHKCLHSDLSPDQQRRKKWLRKESRAFQSLSSLVLHEGFLKDLRQMALFKHTNKLEAFHSVLLKYCQKNLHFHYSSMFARTQLAVLDHNESVRHQQATASTGNIVFPNNSKEWVVKNPTTPNFQNVLVHKVLQRLEDPTILFQDQFLSVGSSPTTTIAQKQAKEEAISLPVRCAEGLTIRLNSNKLDCQRRSTMGNKRKASNDFDKDSDASSGYFSALDQTDFEDMGPTSTAFHRMKTCPQVPFIPGTHPGISPMIVMKNVLLKQPNSMAPALKHWTLNPSLDVVPQSPLVFLQPVIPTGDCTPQRSDKQKHSRRHVPMQSTFPKIAPHPAQGFAVDLGPSAINKKSNHSHSGRHQQRSHGDKTFQSSSLKHDETFEGYSVDTNAVSWGEVSQTVPDMSEKNIPSKLSDSQEPHTTTSPFSLCSDSFLTSSPQKCPSATVTESCDAENISEAHSPNFCKHKRFCNTYNILNRSGLLGITLRTKELIRQNKRSQAQLKSLQAQTDLFLEAICSGDPKVWTRLQLTLQNSGDGELKAMESLVDSVRDAGADNTSVGCVV
ncbi:uncharacterized protein LOC127454857 isoform X2 [Myxocyprinus asiaticus]|uniref:uncharacterized protein LOC127454857 isoform X2 n=1 Tax=Myxocyprinus asiaticus TaxID=70543 RepID=UPI002221A17A|nr:uncharacterized protein LOC127454857 isoform X2 [Myxocyprinus asiaticus]